MREALRLAGEGRVKVEVAETYPLTEVAAAHRALLTQKTRGKIVVTP
ncbi:hypothetical protein BH09ACT10_BH09ACT10_23940 [soil metagenome]